MHSLRLIKYLVLLLAFFSCSSYAKTADNIVTGNAGSKLNAESFGEFNQPWAMTFLPSGDLLVTEKAGSLVLFNLNDRSKVSVKGIPEVAYGGQGGLGDIILHPQYKKITGYICRTLSKIAQELGGQLFHEPNYVPLLSSQNLKTLRSFGDNHPKSQVADIIHTGLHSAQMGIYL